MIVHNGNTSALNSQIKPNTLNLGMTSYCIQIIHDKVPNPLGRYLHSFKSPNGLNFPAVSNLTKSIIDFMCEAKLSDVAVRYWRYYKVILKDLRVSKLIRWRQQQLNVTTKFQQTILDSFIPFTVRVKFEQDFVSRPQFYGEPVYCYVEDIRLHHNVLLCNISEYKLFGVTCVPTSEIH